MRISDWSSDVCSSDLISAALIEQTATLVLLPNPNASREDYVEGLKLTDAEYQVVKSLDERSRCFLVKQEHASSVCQLNLRGMDDALAVISASTDNIEVMHGVLAAKATELCTNAGDLEPAQRLETFYAMRQGSGKGNAVQREARDRAVRSEERRGGQEWVSTCRDVWW